LDFSVDYFSTSVSTVGESIRRYPASTVEMFDGTWYLIGAHDHRSQHFIFRFCTPGVQLRALLSSGLQSLDLHGRIFFKNALVKYRVASFCMYINDIAVLILKLWHFLTDIECE
jgi:hypothetical protein